ncbi:hypothetical protein Dsin_024763 [Dipteronia sinensis]|uniref:Uncharacterized protein n=1 Tax=Dipteronia sinensis TaxID=43782 RepID=A0AAD9ZW25_9ROSI|nr:hypothetical protein Dsin_024763 [Dipteronia sinensis]
MLIGQLPFSYLGVMLFSGRPTQSLLLPVEDKIISKFTKWKGKAFSMACQATLIKSIITSSFVHSFMIYKWHSSLLRMIIRKLRNVLWMGSCEEFKLILVVETVAFLHELYLKHLRKPHEGYVTSSISPFLRAHYSDLLKEGSGSIWSPDIVFVELIVLRANRLGIGCIRNYMDAFLILQCFGLRDQPTKTLVIKSVIWLPPAPCWIKLNTNGAALSSPGICFLWELICLKVRVASDLAGE